VSSENKTSFGQVHRDDRLEPYIFTPVTGLARQYLQPNPTNSVAFPFIWAREEPGRDTLGPSADDYEYSYYRSKTGGPLAGPVSPDVPRIAPKIESSSSKSSSSSLPSSPSPKIEKKLIMSQTGNTQNFGQQETPFPKDGAAQEQANDDQGSQASFHSKYSGHNRAIYHQDPAVIFRRPLPQIPSPRPMDVRSEGTRYTFSDFGTTTTSPEKLMPKPAPFMDDVNDAEGFIARVYLYFTIFAASFTTNSLKIFFFTALCKGPASSMWANLVIQSLVDDRNAGHSVAPQFGTFAQVVTSFRTQFGKGDTKRIASAKLEALRQGEKDLRALILEFNILIEDAGFSGDMAIQAFRRALHPGIRDRLDDSYRPPVTLQEWQDRAVKEDELFQARRIERSLWNPRPAKLSSPPTPAAITTKIERKVEPVKVQATTTTFASRPRAPITDEERERLRSIGGCFYCRQEGHQIRDCPLGKRAAERRLALEGKKVQEEDF
jgi:hypothetical protein